MSALVVAWVLSLVRAMLRVAPALVLLPWVAPSTLAGSMRVALALVLGLPVVVVVGATATLPFDAMVVVFARELVAGAVLAVPLVAPWWGLVASAKALSLAYGGSAEAQRALSSLVIGAVVATLATLGAGRGIVRAVMASEAVFPTTGAASPWRLDTLSTLVERALALVLSATLELSAAVLVAVVVAELVLALGARVTPSIVAVAWPLRVVVALGATSLLLQHLAHRTADQLARALSAPV